MLSNWRIHVSPPSPSSGRSGVYLRRAIVVGVIGALVELIDQVVVKQRLVLELCYCAAAVAAAAADNKPRTGDNKWPAQNTCFCVITMLRQPTGSISNGPHSDTNTCSLRQNLAGRRLQPWRLSQSACSECEDSSGVTR